MNDNTDHKKSSPSVLGTWEYLLDGAGGLCIYTETHVFWIVVSKERQPFQGDQPTEAEKARAFSEAFADACTYTFTGPSRIAIHRLYSINPSVTDFTFEYEIENEVMKYWPLKPDGSRGTMGKARRIETPAS